MNVSGLSELRRLLRRLLPFAVRVELLRLRRWPAWGIERRVMARRKAGRDERDEFGFVLAEHRSPLRRAGQPGGRLQRGKEHNVRKASGLLDGVVIAPCQECSYHHLVGRPSRLRGFRPGLELRSGAPGSGVGGGCCQISNMLYLLALRAGMRITERHRHGLDLFADDKRSVPFGCGATVFYNQADLRFENPLDVPVLLDIGIRDGWLEGRLQAPADPGFRVELTEEDHRFFVQDGIRYRENRIRRRIVDTRGNLLCDQEVAHNLGRVMYPELQNRQTQVSVHKAPTPAVLVPARCGPLDEGKPSSKDDTKPSGPPTGCVVLAGCARASASTALGLPVPPRAGEQRNGREE